MSGFSQTFPPKATTSLEDIPDQMGRVLLVTGGNSGLGRQTCKVLLAKNATVIMAARSRTKAQEAIEELKAETGKTDITFHELDLGDLKKTQASAKALLAKTKRLDVLWNSAGVMLPPYDSKTADGWELQLGTNVIGTWAFAVGVLPLLIKTAKTAPKDSVRIVTTSSFAQSIAPSRGLNLNGDMNLPGTYQGTKYNHSKLADLVLAKEFARRYSKDGIVSVALNPGNIQTELQRHAKGSGLLQKLTTPLMNLILYNVELGALTQLYCGTSPDVTMADSGGFFVPWARRSDAVHPKANDEEQGKGLWSFCEAAMAKASAIPA